MLHIFGEIKIGYRLKTDPSLHQLDQRALLVIYCLPRGPENILNNLVTSHTQSCITIFSINHGVLLLYSIWLQKNQLPQFTIYLSIGDQLNHK